LFNESKESMKFQIEESGSYINMFDDKETATNDVFKLTLGAEDAGWYRLIK